MEKFSTIFYKVDNFYYFLFDFLHSYQAPSEKGIYSERKEFAPKGSKFFPFRVDTFAEGRQKQLLTELLALKVYPFLLILNPTQEMKKKKDK